MASPGPLTADKAATAAPERFRFGRFEFDLASGELRKGGSLVRLRQQPARLLATLLSRPGALVTREELRAHLWSSDTFVDFDQGLNYCVKEIRSAIGDNADAPVFIETLPRRGYRWIGPLERVDAREPPPEPTGAAGWLRPVLAGLAAGLLLALLGWALRAPQTAAPASWQRASFRRGLVSAARFGPGGEIVYTAAWDGGAQALYAASPNAPDPRLVRPDAARLFAVSRRGEALYLSGPGNGALVRAPLAGGAVKELIGDVLAADASADGEHVVATRRIRDGKGVRLEFPLGRTLARLNQPGELRLAPDAASLAVIEHPVAGDDAGHVLVFGADGAGRAVGGDWSSIEGLAWSPRGDEIWVTAARSGADTSVFAIRVDSGQARLVLSAGGRLVLHDIGTDGRLLLERATSRPQVFFGREGQAERELTWLDGSWPQDMTPDGGLLLLAETAAGGGPDYAVYLRPTDGSPPVRLASGRALSLAPDGRSALVTPVREADRIEQVPIGAGEVRVHRVPGIASYLWASLLPDGRLLFSGHVKDHHMRVWLSAPGAAPHPITPEQIVVARDLLSPDGRTLVAACPPQRLCLYPVAGPEPPVPVVGLGSAAPLRWDATGRWLFVAERAGAGSALFRLDPRSGRRDSLRRLAPADPVGAAGMGRILLTPDGRAWAYSFLRRLSELYVVTGEGP